MGVPRVCSIFDHGCVRDALGFGRGVVGAWLGVLGVQVC